MKTPLKPFFISPKDVVGRTVDPENDEDRIQFYNQVGHWLQLTLYRAVKKSLKQDPAMTGNIEDPVSLLTSWILGIDQGGVEIAIHKDPAGYIDGFLIVGLKVPLFTTCYSLNVERIWAATPDILSELKLGLIEYVEQFNGLLPEGRMPIQRIFIPRDLQEGRYTVDIIRV